MASGEIIGVGAPPAAPSFRAVREPRRTRPALFPSRISGFEAVSDACPGIGPASHGAPRVESVNNPGIHGVSDHRLSGFPGPALAVSDGSGRPAEAPVAVSLLLLVIPEIFSNRADRCVSSVVSFRACP